MSRAPVSGTPRGIGALAVSLAFCGGWGLACRAEPPQSDGSIGKAPGPANIRFADVATCVPVSKQIPVKCPGPTCARNVIAPSEPDGIGVDTGRCTLDAVFTRGSVIVVKGQPDVAVHLGRSSAPTGVARVETRKDGVMVVVGFVNGLPPNTEKRCLARCASQDCSVGQSCPGGGKCSVASGQKRGWCFVSRCIAGGIALLDLSSGGDLGGTGGCNLVSNLSMLRFSRYDKVAGTVDVDAVEALPGSFKARTKK